MTMLSIIQDAADELSLPRPDVVAGSTDRQVRQLLAIANREGKEQTSTYAWQALIEQQTFTTVAAAIQPSAVPADFQRFIPDSFFNRTTMRQVSGPITPQAWQLLQARPAASTIYLAYRRRQGSFLITPTPPANETIAYEYISKNWALSSTSVAKAKFTADDDTTYLDEDLVTLGIIWRFLAAKGLPYAEEKKTYEDSVEQAFGADGGAGALGLTPTLPNMNRANLPEGSFGV